MAIVTNRTHVIFLQAYTSAMDGCRSEKARSALSTFRAKFLEGEKLINFTPREVVAAIKYKREEHRLMERPNLLVDATLITNDKVVLKEDEIEDIKKHVLTSHWIKICFFASFHAGVLVNLFTAFFVNGILEASKTPALKDPIERLVVSFLISWLFFPSITNFFNALLKSMVRSYELLAHCKKVQEEVTAQTEEFNSKLKAKMIELGEGQARVDEVINAALRALGWKPETGR